MTDQMTPAELREAAKRLREGRFSEQGAWRTSDIEAGADALDCLAAVAEYAELRAWCHENGVFHIGSTRIYQTPEETVAHVLRLARGDTINQENRSE